MKPGYKTTEFWLAMAPWLIALVVVLALAFGSIAGDVALALLAALGVGGGIAAGKYAESRGAVKSK